MMKWLMGLMLLVFGAGLAFSGGRMVYRSQVSPGWPTVEGTVTSSTVETLRSKRSVSFHPEVRYRYAVGSEVFTSDTLSFGGNDSGVLADAQYYTRHYPSGAKLTLHYQPSDPTVSCVECGSAGVANYVVTLGGAALAVVAAAGLLDMARASRKEKKRTQQPARAGAAR
ncbi:DUF3592 domain-containing protein [Myxococcaceae bacterium JPH2]|nr:DUF3592 domain-containing protein [Myxococcaceae bacterium JPH2]